MLPSTDVHEIEPDHLHRVLGDEATTSVRLVDCREDDEFALCRIEGAELIPLSGFAESAPSRLVHDDAAPVVVYCHHGVRSLQATRFLRSQGLDRVWSLAGGIDRWSREIDPKVPRY